MNWIHFFKKLFIYTLVAWAAGFFVYLYQIYHFKKSETVSDGIVVLTGGRERIQKGIQLLDSIPEKPLLITGVRTRKQLKEISVFSQHEDRINLGFKATTTRGNAKEISEWDKIKSCSSLTVVTSHYHIPRSLLELQATLPHIKLIPYPIISHSFHKWRWLYEPDLWYLLFKEYNKYLIVFFEMRARSILK